MAERVIFADGVRDALRRCQAADNGPEAFVICTYTNKNTVDVAVEGPGFLNAALEKLDKDNIAYILLRKDWKVEMANTVKTVFVDYTPDTLPPTRKALVSTHKGQVTDFFKPFHVDQLASAVEDLDEQDIFTKIGAAAGTHSFETKGKAWSHLSKKMDAAADAAAAVKQQDAAAAQEAPKKFCGECGSPLPPFGRCKQCEPQKAVPQPQQAAAAPAAGQGLNIDPAVTQAIANVHSDAHESTWCAIGYAHKDALKLLAEGSGEDVTDQMLAAMSDDDIGFGMVRVIDIVDKHPTTKFVFVQLMPEHVSAMKKSRVATKKNVIHPLFDPYHVAFEITEKSELSHQILVDKVQAASGTKKWVKEE